MAKYFDKFPIISYDSVPVRNILTRVDIAKQTSDDPKVYIPYKIETGARPELLASRYYEDPNYDWLYYMANDVIDPYNDTHIDESQLNKKIIKKWGSLNKARDKILYYANNWAEDKEPITIAQYEILTLAEKKYYTASVNFFNDITQYRRKQEDWVCKTNKIRVVTVDDLEALSDDEVYYQYDSGGTLVAKGQIASIDTTNKKVYFENISGEFISTSGSYIINPYGSFKNYKTYTTAVENHLPSDPIPSDEAKYWTAVTAYDYENQENEKKRNVRFVRKSLSGNMYQELIKALRF